LLGEKCFRRAHRTNGFMNLCLSHSVACRMKDVLTMPLSSALKCERVMIRQKAATTTNQGCVDTSYRRRITLLRDYRVQNRWLHCPRPVAPPNTKVSTNMYEPTRLKYLTSGILLHIENGEAGSSPQFGTSRHSAVPS